MTETDENSQEAEQQPKYVVEVHQSQLYEQLAKIDPNRLRIVLGDPPMRLADFVSQGTIARTQADDPEITELVFTVSRYLKVAKNKLACGRILCQLFPDEAEEYSKREGRFTPLANRDEQGKLIYNHHAIAHGMDSFNKVFADVSSADFLIKFSQWQNEWEEQVEQCVDALPTWQEEFFESTTQSGLPELSAAKQVSRVAHFRSPFDDTAKKTRSATAFDYLDKQELDIFFDPNRALADHKGTFFHEWVHQFVAAVGKRYSLTPEGENRSMRNGLQVNGRNSWLSEGVTEYITRCLLRHQKLPVAEAIASGSERSYQANVQIIAQLASDFHLDLDLLVSAYVGSEKDEAFAAIAEWFSNELHLHLVEFSEMVEILGEKNVLKIFNSEFVSALPDIKGSNSPINDTKVDRIELLFNRSYNAKTSSSIVFNRLQRIRRRYMSPLAHHLGFESVEEFEASEKYKEIRHEKVSLTTLGVRLTPSERFLLYCHELLDEI